LRRKFAKETAKIVNDWGFYEKNIFKNNFILLGFQKSVEY
jgi:hypothetical protein